MPNSSQSTRLTQHRFSFPDNKFLLDESEKDHHHHHHNPNEHYIVSNGDPQFSENCQTGHNCDSKYRTLPSLRCHSLNLKQQQQTVQQQHSSNNNSTTNPLGQSKFPNSPDYSTQTLGRYHKAAPPPAAPPSSGPNPVGPIQTHLEFHEQSPPVYYVHYPISETQFASYSIDPTTHHQLTSNHSTPLRSILKSSKRFPPNYLTTSESATSSSNNSSDLNHNQAPMSTYPVTQIDPNHQQQQQSLALVFESTNVNAHCESGGIQFIQTSCDNNQTATFVDGGNFVSYLPHHPDPLNNPDLQQQHQELAHLPYLTLTEIYPSPPPPLPQTSQAQTK